MKSTTDVPTREHIIAIQQPCTEDPLATLPYSIMARFSMSPVASDPLF
jgi:hypothetical protein